MPPGCNEYRLDDERSQPLRRSTSNSRENIRLNSQSPERYDFKSPVQVAKTLKPTVHEVQSSLHTRSSRRDAGGYVKHPPRGPDVFFGAQTQIHSSTKPLTELSATVVGDADMSRPRIQSSIERREGSQSFEIDNTKRKSSA